ncbi:uncharacterized protein FIBRA_08566 [Fibroporia radiculosa]|uniref:Uncharacterized protein n=1 Tax=Fibroporia radiculosa TaxID=599839 RepID=J4H588_9APHY|nr:uncharacterized protein FIBRA_08566 [Fibroporia radiculosa]CCM06314.1 predicted protein [Fibroporia radiculosa]
MVSHSHSILNYPGAGAQRITPDNTDTIGSLAWSRAQTCRRHVWSSLFHAIPTVRESGDAPFPARESLPRGATVLQWENDSALLRSVKLSSVLAREEYKDLLEDILRLAVFGTAPAVDHANDSGRASESLLGQEQSLEFWNPFMSMPHVCPSAADAIVTGNTGTGKSTFLLYVLALRLLAGLTTLYQMTSEEVFVLGKEGVFRIPFPFQPEQLQEHIPPATWCLVDSGPEVTTVPDAYRALRNLCSAFVLQAAPLSPESRAWQDTFGDPVPTLWMRPWMLG